MRFIFDENLSKYIPKALSILQNRLNARNNTNHEVMASVDLFNEGERVTEIFKNLQKNDVLLTFDINQQRKWQERIAIDKAGVNIIYFRLSQNLTYWQMVLLFINSWGNILQQSTQ